ncbi:MAG: coproporphyrinogen dehydrogenase HemZ [Clostridia bacterium]|nr:coproporphyrinogen dehydrogenase HemZ [Clostridia bacterium]
MLLIQNGLNCEYEMNVFIRLYFGKDEDGIIFTNLTYENDLIDAYCEIIYNEDTYFGEFSLKREKTTEKENKRFSSIAVTRAFCNAAEKIVNVSLPWGVMCGVRPAKTVTKFLQDGKSLDETHGILKNVYGVSEEKCLLAEEVSKNEEAILSKIKENSVSIYIGIPFCPSRCLYCSFVSSDISVSGKYMNDFTDCLVKEIEYTADILRDTKKVIENIYIGGGTPTALDDVNFEKLLKAVSDNFEIEKVNEYTVEAGRPDTVTEKKLSIIKKYGADRISINPQTTKDETLKRIGRRHSFEDFKNAFLLARDLGFKNINCDLIAGLPEEEFEDFKKSIDDLVVLNPENITVHSMCVKRAADLRHKMDKLQEAETMTRMLSYAQSTLKNNGYSPYYMYRQKNISGNLENVGYAKPGKFSFYNINIMEEAQTIIALGGGGSSKLVTKDGIERIFNYKDPIEYIKNFSEILKRKDLTKKVIGGEINA